MTYRNTHLTHLNIPFIKSQRALLNMTQEDLAAHLGMNPKSFGKWLHNGMIPASALFSMADLFGCSVEELVIR